MPDKIEILNLESSYNFHTDKQQKFLDTKDILNCPARGTAEVSTPNYIKLKYTDLGSGKYYVNVSENADMSNPITYVGSHTKTEIMNLKNNTKYYLQVEKGDIKSDIASFENKTDFIRNINLMGVNNVRDIGDKYTTNGMYIKQGLAFRGGCIDSLSDKGKEHMDSQLKIKTELDLREEEYALDSGNVANYISIKFDYNEAMIDETEKWKQALELFADENNYPIYYHCAIGTDRTGYLSYLLEGILGLSKNDSLVDYMFSNFSNIGSQRTPDTISFYTDKIDAMGEASHQQNVIKWVTNKYNLEMSKIESIQRILTEQKINS